MKKIFLLAISLPFIVCAGFADDVQQFGEKTADTLRSFVTPDHENYLLNNFRSFKTYPITYYQQQSGYNIHNVETSVEHTREYPRNTAMSANVGQAMLSDEIYQVNTANLGEHYEIAEDGVIYNSSDEIHFTKGQVITPLGEVKIDGHYYLVFEPERDGRLLLADEHGQIMHNIGRYYRGEFLYSRDTTSMQPKDLHIIKTTGSKQSFSAPEMQFEIKYDGVHDGFMKFVYVDYSNGRTETALAFAPNQQYIDINGQHIQIIETTANDIQYILRN